MVNDLCHDMFLTNYLSNKTKVITIDDDKDHFNCLDMNWDETAGLKPTQHVRDNRRGFTFHTLVFTSSGLPLGLVSACI